ncbi:MAG TPA: hypothetical protein VHC49_07130 [Mycobacteriales bacterium]|nr:hypothetical protein [Mycobacteriales bacterium]
MSRIITVSPREVAAARLQLVVDAKLGRPTPEVIRKIADAQPEPRIEPVADRAG